jgi:hypothetical protein
VIVYLLYFDFDFDSGKRYADDEIEKQVSAKKQKVVEVAAKKKAQKVVKKESSSDESSSSSEDEVLYMAIICLFA